MKMSKRTDTTSSSLMNIASLPLHRLNTYILGSVQLTVLSLSRSLSVLSFSNTRKRNGPIILPLVSYFSLSTTRGEEEEEEQVQEKKKRLFLVAIGKGHLRTCSSLYSLSYRCEMSLTQYITSPIVNYRLYMCRTVLFFLFFSSKREILIEKR